MKGIKSILIILLILNIFAFIYLAFFLEQKEQIELEEYKNQMGYYDNYQNTLLYPENMETLNKKYTGKVDLYYFTETLTDLINEEFNKIYQNTKQLSQEEVNQYFENNKETIGKTLGIIELKDFTNLVQILEIYNEDLEYKNSVINTDTINVLETVTEFELQINYSQSNLKFKVIISNTDNLEQDAVIKFIPII